MDINMRYFFQRTGHNSCQWQGPAAGRLNNDLDKGFIEKNGFGFEDWNFNKEHQYDGNIYGYTNHTPSEKSDPFGILFAVYDSGLGWSIVGYYLNAQFVEDGPEYSSDIIEQRVNDLIALKSKKSLGGEYKDYSKPQLKKFIKDASVELKWKVSPSNVHLLSYPVLLPSDLANNFNFRFTSAPALRKEKWDTIITYIEQYADVTPNDDYNNGGETEFPEGAADQRLHTVRERSPKLVAGAKNAFLQKHNRLFCEVCRFDFTEKYGDLGRDFIEVHHLTPVHQLAPTGATTSIKDLALVCSNCHRMLHRVRPWKTRKRMKDILLK